MGQEIPTTGFSEADFSAFSARLAEETALLRRNFAEGRLSANGPRIGFELEAWLLDRHCFPAPHNQSFLARLADPQVVPELSRFNIELNGDPQPLAGEGLGRMEAQLAASWGRCIANAHEDVDTVIAIGTLPTLRDADLSPASMTPSNRYAALNRELLRQRGGAAVEIDIDCADPAGAHLRATHRDVMLEAATTSFQLHLQMPAADIARTLDASMALSAPLLALSANSPFLFGQPLWHETRIAVFEQAFRLADPKAAERVTFGSGWTGDDPTAAFAENLAAYPPLLPLAGDEGPERLACLRLHNGTIWRWNRLLAGFDDDGAPHLRIEQRVMPAGPSVIDMLANAAFFYGAVAELAKLPVAELLPFAKARANFYAAARHGMGARLTWLDGRDYAARDLLAQLAAMAREGLEAQGVSPALVDRYLDIIDLRIASGTNGASWQLAHFARHGDVFRLTADYLEHQRSGMPVHEWTL